MVYIFYRLEEDRGSGETAEGVFLLEQPREMVGIIAYKRIIYPMKSSDT